MCLGGVCGKEICAKEGYYKSRIPRTYSVGGHGPPLSS